MLEIWMRLYDLKYMFLLFGTDEPTHQLKCIIVPIVDDETCKNVYPEYSYWGPGMVCAGQENTDNCMVRTNKTK